MKKKKFLDILKTFPDAMAIFYMRATTRRKEFRRIRKTYERWVGFGGVTRIDKLPQTLKESAKKIDYTDETLPRHLNEADFYFIDSFKSRLVVQRDASIEPDSKDQSFIESLASNRPIELTPLQSVQTRIAQKHADEDVSDSELPERLGPNEGMDKQKSHIDVRIENLKIKIDSTNVILQKIYDKLGQSLNDGLKYLIAVNERVSIKEDTVLTHVPVLPNLQHFLFTLHEDLDNKLAVVEDY